jgi:hypothetical protein
MSNLHPIEAAAQNGDWETATRLALAETYKLAQRLDAHGGDVETAAAEALSERLGLLLSASKEPGGALPAKLIFLAMQLGQAQAAAAETVSGTVHEIAKWNTVAEGRRERMAEANPNASAWHLDAFAAEAAHRHYNPTARPADRRAAVFKYMKGRTDQFGKDAFAKAKVRKAPEYESVRVAVSTLAAGGCIADATLNRAVTSAVAHFRPKRPS